jgi:hypothetical protein
MDFRRFVGGVLRFQPVRLGRRRVDFLGRLWSTALFCGVAKREIDDYAVSSKSRLNVIGESICALARAVVSLPVLVT